MSFEAMWEEAEQLLAQDTAQSNTVGLLREASGKLAALEAIDKLPMSEQDKQRLATNAMGKVLLVMTQLSMKHNINTYEALRSAIDDSKILILEKQYSVG